MPTTRSQTDTTTTTRRIRFQSFSRRRQQPRNPRLRRPLYPPEPWTDETRAAYTKAYSEISQGVERIGPNLNPCLMLYQTKKVTVKYKLQTEELQLFHHLPYKLAYLQRRERIPTNDEEVSHMCGEILCVNPYHLVAETH